ncbi:MAG: amidohydrolase [Lysobacteraceae bacterium]|nr:MAG: amidohydrolase [Xanthomonadaceae bacterium]
MLRIFVIVVALSASLTHAVKAEVDSIFINGRIYTVDPDQPWAEAVAVTDNRFSFVGSTSDAQQLAGPQTEVVDLQGRFVMPGIYDMHIHPDLAFGPRVAGQVILTQYAPPEQIKQELLDYAKANPDKEWIVGEPWFDPIFKDQGVQPGRDWLDSFLPDRPVAILDDSRHILMINSKGLELAGLDENTFEPDHGIIHKDPETGRLLGLLQDGAQTLAEHAMPALDWRIMEEAYRQSLPILNGFGIVAARSNHVNTARLRGLQMLERKGELTVRFDAAISWKDDIVFTVPDRAELLSGERFRYRSEHVNPNYIKFHLDGSFGTAYLLEPYAGEMGKNGWRGALNENPWELRDIVVDMDRRGITVVAHAIGDGAIRLALDAYEHMREKNGMSDLRHSVAHMNFATPEDLARFEQLNIIPEFGGWQMWNPDGEVAELVPLYIGEERMSNYFNIRGALDNGAMPVISSDWPVSLEPNPFPGIRDMVNRGGKYGWQDVDLSAALKIVTYNGAYAMYLEDEAGSITEGNLADFIVLDRNLFEASRQEIGETSVLRTVFEGKTVYEMQ